MYAPIETFSLREHGNKLVGYAAPARGPAPCLLRLTVDATPIAVARATRFSDAARSASLRLGWCGVEVPGLAMAASLGPQIEVRCGVTDRVIWKKTVRSPIAPPAGNVKPLSAFEIIALSREVDAASDISLIEPFMRQHLATFGIAHFVDATFRTLLGRTAEPPVIAHYEAAGAAAVIPLITSSIVDSAEYRRAAIAFIPGPFNAAFCYDMGVLDRT